MGVSGNGLLYRIDGNTQCRCASNDRAVAKRTPLVRWPPEAGRFSNIISSRRTIASMSINIPIAWSMPKHISIICDCVSKALRVLYCSNCAIGDACFVRKSLRPMLNTNMCMSHSVRPMALHIFICFVFFPVFSVGVFPLFRTTSCALLNASIIRTLIP